MIIEKRNSTTKFQIIIYLSMTYLSSWIAWGILYAINRNIISHTTYNTLSYLLFEIGAFMPSIMAIILTAFFYGSNGIKGLLKKLIIWRANPLFYVFVLFYSLAYYIIPIWICNITGSSYKLSISVNFYNVLINFLLIMLLGGPLEEELGWRGFLLPKLQSKLNSVYSSIFVGIFWACWHLPLFFIRGTSQYGSSFSFFIIFCIAISILFTWVYNRTNGSLLFPILFHTSVNVTGTLLSYNSLAYLAKSFNKYTVITVMLQLVFVLFVILDMIKEPLNFSQ